MKLSIEQIAEIAYGVNRLYCLQIEDCKPPCWNDIDDEKRRSYMAGVQSIMSDPGQRPEQTHQLWMASLYKDGWKYGKIKNAKKKEHPCFMSFQDLPEEQQVKDYLFNSTVNSLLMASYL